MGQLVFIAGLPRSGSTLLTNLLGQNPLFRVSATSGLVDVLLCIRNTWGQIHEHQADPKSDLRRRAVLWAVLEEYHGHSALPDNFIVFDKSRPWLAHLEMAEELAQKKAKVLVPVRDIRDVLCSTELLWRQTSALQQFPWERGNYAAYQTLQGRLKEWMDDKGIIGIAYNRIRDALARGLGDRMHLVFYEELCRYPSVAMSRIYDFLEAKPFLHDFEHVEDLTHEDDRVHGIPGLHDIRPRVEWRPSRWLEILGSAGAVYGQCNPAIGIPMG